MYLPTILLFILILVRTLIKHIICTMLILIQVTEHPGKIEHFGLGFYSGISPGIE